MSDRDPSTMNPTDSSLELVPRRRTSLLSKPRPMTAHGVVSQEPQDFAVRRYSGLPTLRPEDEDFAVIRACPSSWQGRGFTPVTPSPATRPETERPVPYLTDRSLPPRPRRSPSISQSWKDGVSDIKAFTRRMSASLRGKSNKNRQEMNTMSHAMNGSYETVWTSPDDAALLSTPRPKSRAWLRSPTTRRRPSLPLLDFTAATTPPSYSVIGPVPGSSRGPPILPDDMWCGAGARAAAAAQNEAFQANRDPPQPPTELYYKVTGMGLVRDSESGIGIDIHARRGSGYSDSAVVRMDPTTVLPSELMEGVFQYLDSTSLLQASQVSHEWRLSATSQAVWREVFTRQYPRRPATSSRTTSRPAAGVGKNIPNQDWRTMYRVRSMIDQRWAKGEAAAVYLKGHKDSVYCAQFDEHKIITGSRDNTIRVWDTHTYQCIRKLGPPNNARERTELQFDEVEPRGLQPTWTLDYKGPDPVSRTPLKQFHSASILCLQYDDDILVTGSSDFTSLVWSIKDDYQPIYRLVGHTAGVLDVCIDDERIITCSKDTTIKIWDRFSGRLLKTLFGHRGPVNAVQVRGNLLASASGDGMSKLWRLEDGLCIKEFSSRDRGLACVEFSEDGRTIFAGGNDHVIYEYDTVTGNTIRQMRGHKDLVRSLHLDSANGRIISGSYDLSVKVWDSRGGSTSSYIDDSLRINFEGWTTSWMLSAKSDYRKIVCTSQDGRVLIIDFGYGIEGVEMLEA